MRKLFPWTWRVVTRCAAVTLAVFQSVILSCGAQSGAQWIPPDSSDAAFRPLFDHDLANAIFEPGVWSYRDGVLTAIDDHEIWTEDLYDRFVLDLEYRISPGSNSGILVYASSIPDWVTHSLEIQILDDGHHAFEEFPPEWRNASFFGHRAPDTITVRPPGEWNRMTIWADGPVVTVALNGTVVNEMDLRQWTSGRRNPDGSEIPEWLSTPKAEIPTSGHIGLQGRHGEAEVWFRRVRIREL